MGHPFTMEELRYVVLHHTGVAEPHYDLMFETAPGGKLETFRSHVWPPVDDTEVVPLGEHRREYLEYEGPVSGGRGRVKRVAAGTYRAISRAGNRREVELDGTIVAFHVARES